MDGYCLQSINRQMGAPFYRPVLHHTAILPSNASRNADPCYPRQNPARHFPLSHCCILIGCAIAFIWLRTAGSVGRVRNQGIKIPGWNALMSFSVSPCRIRQCSPPRDSTGDVPSFIRLSSCKFSIGIILSFYLWIKGGIIGLYPFGGSFFHIRPAPFLSGYTQIVGRLKSFINVCCKLSAWNFRSCSSFMGEAFYDIRIIPSTIPIMSDCLLYSLISIF